MNVSSHRTDPMPHQAMAPTASATPRRSRSLAFAACVLVGVLVAACGASSAPTNGVATLEPGAGASSNPSASSSASANDPDEAMLAYSQCMRDNGVPSFPDPVNGGLSIDGNKVDMDSPAYKAAEETCESVMPPPPAGSEEDAADREGMLAYAQCMRDNGVANFPDPKPGEGISLDGDNIDLDSPAFKAAEESCSTLPGAPGGDGSQEPSVQNSQP